MPEFKVYMKNEIASTHSHLKHGFVHAIKANKQITYRKLRQIVRKNI